MAYQNGPRMITDGLVLYLDSANAKSYPGSGTVWTDLSGNGNNGTLINAPIFDGNFFTFGESNQRCTISSPVSTSGFMTANIWYRRNESVSSTSWRTLFATTSTNIHHLISQQSSRNLGIWDGSFKDFLYNPPQDSLFHNYAVIYQSTVNATLYVDGVFVNTISTILNLQTSPLGSIGNWSSGG
jgi:hypothetical protein